jgi:hypothetical protein
MFRRDRAVHLAWLTLLEVIFDAFLASGGHVTQAILAVTPQMTWQT